MGKTAICKIIDTKEGIKIKARVNDDIKYFSHRFAAYFYIEADDYDDVKHLIKRYCSTHEEVKDNKNKLFLKLFLKNNFHRNKFRNELEDEGVVTYESDIPANKRFMIDNNMDLGQENLKCSWYDLETLDTHGWMKDKKGNIVPAYPILSIALKQKTDLQEYTEWYVVNHGLDGEEFDEYKILHKQMLDNPTNNDLKKQVVAWRDRVEPALFKGERQLLIDFLNEARKYDLLSAYNGSGFDDVYIRERAKKHNIDSDKLLIINFDYLLVIKKDNYEPVKSYKLNDIAYQFLKKKIDDPNSKLSHVEEITKVDWKEKTNAQRIFDLFVCYPELLREYNVMDVLLMDLIEKELNYFNIHFVQTRQDLGGCLIMDTLYSSRILDIIYQREHKARNSIRPARPKDSVIEKRKQQTVGGGFVLANKGYYIYVDSLDVKSEYPTLQITYNISPDTYLRKHMPDLTKVFSGNEISFIEYAIESSENYLDNNGKIKKKKYEQHLKEKSIELSVDDMDTLMWKFIDKYDQVVEHEDFETYTPADLNLDTSGWRIHPHYFFDNRIEGVQPKILKKLILERDKTKYTMKEYKNTNPVKYKELSDLSLGLKILANSGYGVSIFPAFRDYVFEVGDAITTSGRVQIKKTALFCQAQGWFIIFIDTDSVQPKTNGVTPKEINLMLYNFFDEYIKPFNTKCEIEHYHPITGEKIIKNHFIVFEHEKVFKKLLMIKKKRYYYIEEGSDEIQGKGGSQTRSDVLQSSKDLQLELLRDIFDEKFDVEHWRKKLLDVKDKILNHKIDVKEITKSMGISKELSEYGSPMMDAKTGLQKTKKDGSPRFANIPAHIKLAMQMEKDGQLVSVGDKIHYIVKKNKPIVPISVEEYMRNKIFDTSYYIEAAMKPILEVMFVYNKDYVFNELKDCWYFTPKQLERLEEKMDDEEESEKGDDLV